MKLYLQAETRDQAKAALPDFVDAGGRWIRATHQWALDPIGQIMTVTPVYDGEGNEVTPAEFGTGWHGNIFLLDESLLPMLQSTGLLIDAPATPYRDWA
ncbi:hypothetical protein [Ferrovibrio sp.]|uniref:hypothetical protein n=1 Tax=Ferrovibrio sp. TaxID=1917215 RepID=UPI003D11CA09